MLTMRASRPSGEASWRSGRSRAVRFSWKTAEVESWSPPPRSTPRPGQRGEQGNGAYREGAALAALHSIVEADGGGTDGRVFARQFHDILGAGFR